MDNSEVRYEVECLDCGQVFAPALESPLGRQARTAAQSGRLDCIRVSGEKCGCVKKQHRADAPFRVFGYDDMCRDFDIPFDNFVEAVKKFLDLNKFGMNIVFISGVSPAVRSRLDSI